MMLIKQILKAVYDIENTQKNVIRRMHNKSSLNLNRISSRSVQQSSVSVFRN